MDPEPDEEDDLTAVDTLFAYMYLEDSRGGHHLDELKAATSTAQQQGHGNETSIGPTGSLVYLMLKEPLRFQKIMKRVIYRALIDHKLLPVLQNIGQLLVTVRLTTLPPCPELEMESIKDLSRENAASKYYTFDGVIVALSTTSKYTLGASYLCTMEACPGSVGNKFTRFHVPGAHEKQTVSDKFLCTFCGGHLRENLKARVLADKVLGEMVPNSAFNQTSHSSFSVQAITVYFRGNLTKGLKIGHSYSVIAMPICKSRVGTGITPGQCTYVLEANSLEDITNVWDCFVSLSWSIDELLIKFQVEDLADSPYVRPLVLALAFAECMVPSGLFIKLKLGILLRLVNCGTATKKTRASLLVVGHETSLVDCLLRYGATFAPRLVPLTVETQLRLTYSRRKTSGALFVDGNPIVLASTGVCYLGDVGKFSTTAKRTLANILDTGTVPLDVSNSMLLTGQPSTSTLPYPMECQFWAYIDPPNTAEYDGEDFAVTSKPKTDSGRMPKYLLDAFGLVHYVDNLTAQEKELTAEALEDHLLDQACGYSNGENTMSDANLNTVLHLARLQEVTFDTKAELLIQDYFVTSRSIRGSGDQTTPVPLSAILALTCTAESLAKLSLRNVVTETDAILAIYLYEECVTSRYGVSFLHVRPQPHSFGCDTRTRLMNILSDLEQFVSLLRHHIPSSAKEKAEE